MKKNISIISIIVILSNIFIYSYEKYVDFDLIKEAGAPRFVKDGILFTLPGKNQPDAFIRTNIDEWQKNHRFKPNLYDVLYTFIPLSSDTQTIKYKININGYWITDPYNNEYIYDELGTKISILDNPESLFYFESTPIIKPIENNIKKVTFMYFDNNAKEVNFVCSIDNWSEYSHPMRNMNDGHWEIIKYFPEGTYMYYFLVDGKKVVDITNPKRLIGKRNGAVSLFSIQ